MDKNATNKNNDSIQNPSFNMLAWLKERVEKGDKKADVYMKAIESDSSVSNEVFQWMIELANNGDVDAQYNLGLHYKQTLNGNDEKAVEWFVKAADNGHILSCWNLGMYYEYCFGNIEKDVDKAIEWYTKVAGSDADYAQDAKGRIKNLNDLLNI